MPLGVHIALTPEQRATLLALETDDARREFVEEVEETIDEKYTCDSDKAWDAIHRCLGEFPPNADYFTEVPEHWGTWDSPDQYGSEPLRLAVLGGRKIHSDEKEYFIRLIETDQVGNIADAMNAIDDAEIRRRYTKYCNDAWGGAYRDSEDIDYTAEYFGNLKEFFAEIAKTNMAIIFTADQ